MAARSILRRRQVLWDHLNGQNGSIHTLSSFGNGRLKDKFSIRFPTQVTNTPTNAEAARVKVAILSGGERSFGLLISEYLRCNPSRTFTRDFLFGRPEIVVLRGLRWISSSQLRAASVVTSGEPETRHSEKSKEFQARSLKEASPEECDQAVEGLSSVKAKAKMKRLQQSRMWIVSILRGFWSRLLRIGPALRAIASMSRLEDWIKKLHYWKDEFVLAIQHYWLGLKLLWANIRMSSRLLLKLARGKSLSRRERQQLTLTTADIFRLFPLAVIIIVPFMDFLLPVLLKVFPNMLPSTFQDKMKEEEALKKRLNARLEYAKFLQETAKEMAKEVQSVCGGETQKTAEELEEFLNRVRTGAHVYNEEILGFAKLFNDELTLDNLSRPRLVSMCKYMGINPYGSDRHLRNLLRKKLAEIRNDDKMIHAEGVESLSEAELRQACRDRGMLGIRPVEDMRQMLRDWLDLSLNHSVPSSLLILSRAFILSGVRPEEAVQATLSSLPDEVVETVGVTALPSVDSVSERRRKLELLKMQEELIKDEERGEEAQIEDDKISKEEIAMKEIPESIASEAERLSNLSRALAILSSASSVSREREEFLHLVSKEIELYNNMVGKEGTDDAEEAKKAFKAAQEETDHIAEAMRNKVSEALMNKVDIVLQKLEKEIDDVDAKIGNRWQLLDRDNDGKVTPEEVAAAATYLKNAIGQGVQELVSNHLLKDHEGKILVEDIVNLEQEQRMKQQ